MNRQRDEQSQVVVDNVVVNAVDVVVVLVLVVRVIDDVGCVAVRAAVALDVDDGAGVVARRVILVFVVSLVVAVSKRYKWCVVALGSIGVTVCKALIWCWLVLLFLLVVYSAEWGVAVDLLLLLVARSLLSPFFFIHAGVRTAAVGVGK